MTMLPTGRSHVFSLSEISSMRLHANNIFLATETALADGEDVAIGTLASVLLIRAFASETGMNTTSRASETSGADSDDGDILKLVGVLLVNVPSET